MGSRSAGCRQRWECSSWSKGNTGFSRRFRLHGSSFSQQAYGKECGAELSHRGPRTKPRGTQGPRAESDWAWEADLAIFGNQCHHLQKDSGQPNGAERQGQGVSAVRLPAGKVQSFAPNKKAGLITSTILPYRRRPDV